MQPKRFPAFNDLKRYIRGSPVEEIVVALDDRRKKLPLDDLLSVKWRR